MPHSMQEVIANIIAGTAQEMEKEPDAMRRAALSNAVFRLTEGLWWLNAAVDAGRLIQRP